MIMRHMIWKTTFRTFPKIKNRDMGKQTTHSSMGLEGFGYIYFHLCRSQFIKSLKWAGVLTLLIVVCGIFMSSKDSLQLVSIITEIGLKVMPPLLGFTLSSFALVIGFKDDALMNKLKKHQTRNGISMYLQLVVTFIAMLGSVFICLLLCVVSHLILSFGIEVGNQIFEYTRYGNYACFVLMTFVVFYALFAVKDLLSNLFSLGRASNSLYQAEKRAKVHNQNIEIKSKKYEDNNVFVYIFMGILSVAQFIHKVVCKSKQK